MVKFNYYLKSLEIISSFEENQPKPRLLLHVCCAPCATYPLLFLSEHFKVTIYFNNSNIYPFEEYDKRLKELEQFLETFSMKENISFDLVVTNYNYNEFKECLKPLQEEPEGGSRCHLCFEKRLSDGFNYAQENNFDYFTTAMTISRFKNAQVLNQIGAKLEENSHSTKYFYSDFKKKAGIDIAKTMRDEYELYQQDYCGCEYSIYPKNIKK